MRGKVCVGACDKVLAVAPVLLTPMCGACVRPCASVLLVSQATEGHGPATSPSLATPLLHSTYSNALYFLATRLHTHSKSPHRELGPLRSHALRPGGGCGWSGPSSAVSPRKAPARAA
mgnify:CR=1 FL=1